MKELYQVAGFTKQAHWQWYNHQQTKMDKWLLLEPILMEWRANHPSMSLKKLYHRIDPDFVGINQFIGYCMDHGFESIPYKKPPKTSIFSSKKDYPNLLTDLKICDINQVWVSDTTYYRLWQKWYYLTFIMDLYSRRIIGYHASDRLFAQANLSALQMAFDNRGISNFDNKLIHHSDRGSQFKSTDYVEALQNAGIQISMGQIVYDNIHSERCHQTIKGEYLKHRNIKTQEDLFYHLKKDVEFYNVERPHLALGMKSPDEFESYLSNVPLCQRTFLKVFAAKSNKTKTLNSNVIIDPNQLLLAF
jgi:putative transposase